MRSSTQQTQKVIKMKRTISKMLGIAALAIAGIAGSCSGLRSSEPRIEIIRDFWRKLIETISGGWCTLIETGRTLIETDTNWLRLERFNWDYPHHIRWRPACKEYGRFLDAFSFFTVWTKESDSWVSKNPVQELNFKMGSSYRVSLHFWRLIMMLWDWFAPRNSDSEGVFVILN